jgi:TolB protein
MNIRMKKLVSPLIALAALVIGLPAQAQLRLTISSGVTDPIPIAVVPFAASAPTGADDVASIIQRDLESTGRFKGMDRGDMINKPTTAASVVAAEWKQMRNDYVVVGRVTSLADGRVKVEADLVNALTGVHMDSPSSTAQADNIRMAAHRIADALHQKILGVPGAFATKIAYISVDGRPPNQKYELYVADSDGANRKRIGSSNLPLMSPAWSPNGEWLAYVSFERRTSAVFVQEVRTGRKILVSARAGINGAPTYSRDGKKLALTLSGSNGNLDIYLLDLASQQLTRLTDDPGIDTEASFDDKGNVYFTSDRSGSPQIYRLTPGSADRPKRVTFTGSYNARPRVSPDGKQLALLTLADGGYRIAIQDLATNNLTVLSKGRQEESPSFAPNGTMLIFAGRERGQGVLQTVSTDGLTTGRLDADAGEVREPIWGPFLP